MESVITVRSVFDFRGETFCYESDIALPPSIDDMDLFLEQLPNRVAKQNQLDVISYKFEMLQSTDMEVIRFQSRIESDEVNLPMLIEDFLEIYQVIGPESYLRNIADKHQLNVDEHPQMAQALREAYQLGHAHKPKKKMPTHNGWW
ncbi:hypothetical protein [Thiomicrorhabdus sp. Milos-T2]|uniref:hypothetical protein n=1 Tax=Thiomicrorhabdus sp. Milos-T2 TaxID=90814 RepID=UPI0004943F53|nr:hypothetical protein [Thiomicrorhabdus sp. Milos-T2]